MRLWSPVRSDQFGGNSRLREGVWGEINYNYWLITKGKKATIGYVDPDGNQNYCYNGTSLQFRTNNMDTSRIGSDFGSGVTLRIGNQVAHNGWELKTTIMQAQTDTYQGTNGEMDILDGTSVYVVPIQTYGAWYFTGDPNRRFDYKMGTGIGREPNIPASYLWGWFYDTSAAGGDPLIMAPDMMLYALAPLPLTFDRYKIESKINHWDVEANYIYRTHATRRGDFFEFTGGVRYMELDDQLNFAGWGMPWRGEVRINTVDPTPAGGTTTTTGGTTTNTNTTGTTAVDVTDFYLQQGILPGTNRDYQYTGTSVQGVGTALADSKWNFEAQNHMVGPQAGIRYIRKNGRWAFIADTKFFAAFNTQNLKSRGVMASRTAGYTPETLTMPNPGANDEFIRQQGVTPWVPVGFMSSGKEFNHTKTRTDFSPGIDFSLKANWQFTDAISFNAGYQGMWIDNTARASMVNEYSMTNESIFGINDKVTQATYIHGVTVGVEINRF
ncbi:MAG: BBP7 family outer membrane beta-barrel protein [Planctomycetaceae bacterium]|nr:BBP7 family outer membrane beta-barrel protein [Planctomycetaceae bacterium]